MSAARFLGRLREQGIELRAEGDKLVVNAPKGAVTAEVGDEIRRRKSELLSFLRMGSEGGAVRAPSDHKIPRRELIPGQDGIVEAPLSFGQRRLFYLDQLEPGLAVYNVPVAFWLSGDLDVAVLEEALSSILDRHSILRTTLALGRDGPVQCIGPAGEVRLERVELDREPDPERRAARCREVLSEHARRPFDLTTGPLFRAVLIRMAATEHVLLVVTHHVVTDGWSQDVFESELCSIYAAKKEGRASTLAEPPIQYSDYAAWQVGSTADPDRARRVQYWKDNLTGPLPALELPTAHARPSMAPTEGDIESLVLPADLVEPLAALGRRDGATLFMVLLAAYATLLGRISGQSEIVVGTPIANRTHEQTLDLIGYFANTLALRIDLRDGPTFRELLRRVKETCLGAYAHQDIPFEELVEVLDVERDLSRSPIFQTIFAFEDAMPTAATRPADGAAAHPLRVTRRETVHAKVARTDLSAWVSASEEGLVVTFEYPTALFDADGVRRLLGHFRVLLRSLADGADGPIAQLPILSSAERTRILSEWNATEAPLPDVARAHQLIERRVDATPDRDAVVFGDEVISYQALDERANRLSHHLIAAGAQPAHLVGVFIDRSVEMVIALLAIHKLGGTYVPLDPEYPADRIAFMIDDSKLRMVITKGELRERLPTDGGASKLKVIDLAGEAAEIEARSAERPAPGVAETNAPSEEAAYVIYTSGSTGRPKGVVVPHRALINFLSSVAKRPGLDSEDVLVAVTTLSFDIAGLEIFLPLTVGAKLVVASADQASDGDELRRLVEQSAATVMQATPATWRLLIGAGWEGRPELKILIGGEAFPSDLLQPLCERAGSVWNMYGPTETTIWSTCTSLSADDPRITIGRPIDNTSIYVLDAAGQPMPVGVPGELVIGGLGVSSGYLFRPELTDERFVPDPFAGRSEARMYRTGDLAAFRADGMLVYHRRLDHQVKVRGYRIELGEIETVLTEHPAIAEGVVIVREDRPGDARLCAYIVARSGETVTPTDLRRHLKRRLPDYMIPQHFMELDALPLTPAGKIARRSLPAPTAAAPAADERPAETPAEVFLAAIWKDVLGVERVGAGDNFFELGGHSLLSMGVVARVQAEIGTRISPRSLLLNTLEQIASQLSVPEADHANARELRAPPETRAVPSTPLTDGQPPPMTGADQAGLVSGLVSRIKGRIFG